MKNEGMKELKNEGVNNAAPQLLQKAIYFQLSVLFTHLI